MVASGSRPRIAADSKGHLFVAFEANAQGTKISDIFFSESTDDGKTWSSPVDISKTKGVSLHPAIAVEKSGALDVVWSDTGSDPISPDIFFVRSADGGTTWTEPMDISNTPGVSGEPTLAIAPDDSIHVVWTDSSKGMKNKDIYYTSSTDAGKHWAKDPLLPAVDISNTTGASSEPTIAVAPDNIIHVAWADSTPGTTHPDIFYTQNSNNKWTTPVNISHSPRVSAHPALSCGKEKVFLCWSDNSKKENAADIWLAVGDKNGKFAEPINVSNTPGVSSEPAAAADQSGEAAIVWSDTSTGTKTPSIFAKASLDNASGFTAVMDLSNNKQCVRIHPDVTVSGGKMFVVWEEPAGKESTVKTGSIELNGLATVPAQVDPSLHSVPSMH